IGDYAEYLCETALGLKRTQLSTRGYDAVDGEGKRYEIKARRITKHNQSRQLGAIRSLDEQPFDFLIGVLFDEGLGVLRACQVSHETVMKLATYRKHTNSWCFILRDSVWSEPGAKDVTYEIASANVREGL